MRLSHRVDISRGKKQAIISRNQLRKLAAFRCG